jgi:hypothetical protein
LATDQPKEKKRTEIEVSKEFHTSAHGVRAGAAKSGETRSKDADAKTAAASQPKEKKRTERRKQ